MLFSHGSVYTPCEKEKEHPFPSFVAVQFTLLACFFISDFGRLKLMGVHGLWKLIESAGKPVPVETLENKILAVDVSIWLHQLMKGYQTPAGASVANAYLLGLFSRVCKLLFTNVKPVFVFDGGVPQLKKKTIAARQQQKSKSVQAQEKLREQLLKNILKQKAVGQVLEEIRGQTSPKKKAPDMFELPPLPQVEESDVEEMSYSSSEEDVKPIKMKYRDLHTIDVKSEEFKSLPADMRHDILTELKETRKQNSWGRVHEMPEESGDFSKYQMGRLLKRRSVQVSLEEAEKEMGGRTLSLGDVEALLADGGIEINPQLGKRIAADNTTRYIYVTGTGESRSQIKENLTRGDKSEMSSSANVKEEIIDCDELSDSELIQELENIERVYNEMVVKKEEIDPTYENENEIISFSTSNAVSHENINQDPVDSDSLSDTEGIKAVGNVTAARNNCVEEENIEFGTDIVFENESSTEGVIIDGMDLVNDNSGLSQEQLLALIKQENIDKLRLNELIDENIPSTSMEAPPQLNLPEPISKSTKPNLNDLISQKGLRDQKYTSKASENAESKILDSLYFKMMPRMKCFEPNNKTEEKATEINVDKKSSTCVNSDKVTTKHSPETEVKNTNAKSAPTISDLKARLIARRAIKNNPPRIEAPSVLDIDKLVDSAIFSSSDSETEINNQLPCLVSEVSMPTSKCDLNLKSDNDKAPTKTHVSQSPSKYCKFNKDSVGSHIPLSRVDDNLVKETSTDVEENPVSRKNCPKSSATRNLLNFSSKTSSHFSELSSKEAKPVYKETTKIKTDKLADLTLNTTGSHFVKSSSTNYKKGDISGQVEIKFGVSSKPSHCSSGKSSKSIDANNKINILRMDEIPENKSLANSQLLCDSGKTGDIEIVSLKSKESSNKTNITEIDDVTYSTSSESDGDFVEVSQSDNSIPIPERTKATCGLQIEIEPIPVQIEDDIFADIFTDKDKSNHNTNKTKLDETVSSTNSKANAASLQSKETFLKENNNVLIKTTSKSTGKNVDLGTFDEEHSIKSPISRELLNAQNQTTSLKNIKQIQLVTEPDELFKDVTSNIIPNYNSDEASPDIEPNSFFPTKNQDEEVIENSEESGSLSEEGKLNSAIPEEKPKRKLNMKQLEKLQEILETKEREIIIDQNREDRMSTSITDQMYQEAQELLRLFGVPFVVAPMEAEAQCAFMDYAGLTQGTITDDSDIWLFGANKVYKNFFDQKKFVLEFQANDIQNYFKLNRNLMVLLALLVGSDYTVGLQGVGPVTAMEILATFPPQPNTVDTQQLLASLQKFRDWWEARSPTHGPLAKKLRNIELHQGFPSSAVANAYFQPMVDDSREPFSWGEPDLSGLRDYAERKFGWSRSRTDQTLLPVIDRLNKKSSQTTLHTFFGAIPNISAHREQMSKRVQSAVNRLEGGAESFEPVQPRPRQPRARGRGTGDIAERGASSVRSRVRARGRGRGVLGNDEQLFAHGSLGNQPEEVIPQREKDKQEALKRKQQAIDLLKSKKKKLLRKRKNVRQEKQDANLSESSDDN